MVATNRLSENTHYRSCLLQGFYFIVERPIFTYIKNRLPFIDQIDKLNLFYDNFYL